MPHRSRICKHREKNLLLILLAALIAILLWNSIWALIQLAVFLAAVYVIYTVLKTHI